MNPEDVKIRTPDGLTEDDKTELIALIRLGGAVGDGPYVAGHITRAALIATFSIGKKIVSAAVIKRPSDAYVAKVDRKSGCTKSGCTIGKRLEFGYLVTAPVHRGKRYGGQVASRLLQAYGDALFATTTSDLVRGILERHDFVRCGREWAAEEQVDGILTLWLRD